MTNCPTCGNRDYLCEKCQMEALEDRHGTPADQDVERWVLGDDRDLWHAAVEFDGQTHTCLCGGDVETPLEWSTEDLRYAPDRYDDTPVCRGCVVALEGTRSETVPDDATFERASELATDGGIDQSPDDTEQQIENCGTCEDCGGRLDDDGLCPHCFDYDAVDERKEPGDLSPEEAAFGHVRRTQDTETDRGQLTAKGWFALLAAWSITLFVAFMIGTGGML
ncbi:hypothetical protein RBH26_20990 [Natronolimnohabitans sp. A-GB9]|uniref:hypothetical protein n=1 Tax=Natronolimnohabitans sp. A-GB9 TaxID=3069757 RepID=UPI0027B6A7A0|nr:hypothetical protein [Natronolimnohabitans sp. A-GB9]MDQ2052921.1 hypothetical protein [Natronolimnohabitans sp. A-GB9]